MRALKPRTFGMLILNRSSSASFWKAHGTMLNVAGESTYGQVILEKGKHS